MAAKRRRDGVGHSDPDDAQVEAVTGSVDGLEQATCEIMCEWAWDRLSTAVADLTVVAIAETITTRCVYHGEKAEER